MITFEVVKEEHGWAVRMGERMSTPFWAKDAAIREANRLAEAIRDHGECTEVLIEGANPGEEPKTVEGASSARLAALLATRR